MMYLIATLITAKTHFFRDIRLNIIEGWFFAPVVYFVDKYLLSDWQFVMNLIVIVLIDTILGFIVAYKNKTISSRKFGKVLTKLLVYICLLSATHNVSHYTVHGEYNQLFQWLDSVVYATIMVRELLSVFEKTTLLGIFKPPAWLLEKFDIYKK